MKVNWKWSNEMARLNTDILRINELEWTGMGEFNLNDHCIYYYGQESLRKKWSNHQSTKESEMQYLDAVSKMTK